MHTVNYLSVTDSTHAATKKHEELQDRPPKQQEETFVALPIHQLTKPLKMMASLDDITSTDVIFTSDGCNRIIAKI